MALICARNRRILVKKQGKRFKKISANVHDVRTENVKKGNKKSIKKSPKRKAWREKRKNGGTGTW
jgi:hypothetical protein